MHLHRAVRTCSYCGKENNDVSRHCLGCGTRLEAEETPAPDVFRSTAEFQQDQFAKALKELSFRRCSCGSTMVPLRAYGTFGRLGGAGYAISVAYECPSCRRQVEIPNTTTFFTYGAFSLFFMWQSANVLGQQRNATFNESAVLLLIFLSPGLLTAGLMLRGWRRRRKYPPVRN